MILDSLTIQSPVIKLQSNNNVERFSVISNGSAEFVTIFNIKKTTRRIAKCHSSVCAVNEVNSRNVSTLATGQMSTFTCLEAVHKAYRKHS